MISKQYKLVFIGIFIRMLDTAWNTLYLPSVNNLEENNGENYLQCNFTAPEYREKVQRHTPYNDPIIDESYNAEILTYQYNSRRPVYQQCEREAQGRKTYNDHIIWEFYNTEIPTYNETGKSVINQKENEGYTIQHLVGEIREAGYGSSSGMQMPGNEYSRQAEELIIEEETTELMVPKDNLEGMPLLEPAEEYRPHDKLKDSHNLEVPQLTNDPNYEYTNSMFLDKFLHSPSPSITVDSIRTRFGPRFFSFLSTGQIVRVLCVLLENRLELPNEDRKALIQMIFGYIDYSLELIIPKDQVIILVKAMIKSNEPDYFEQVFLTWKMWYSFTKKEQEVILKSVSVEKTYKKETLMMLYLFVMNRDGDNSHWCKILRNVIINTYKNTRIFKNRVTLEKIVRKIEYWQEDEMYDIFNTFDICLLDIPEIFKNMTDHSLIAFRDYIRKVFFGMHWKASKCALRYKIHICYVFTKFTQEFTQSDDEGSCNDNRAYDRLYFCPKHISRAFMRWKRFIYGEYDPGDEIIPVRNCKNDFMNAFGMLRQVIQSSEYTFDVFFELFSKATVSNIIDKPYFILLFFVTKESILKKVLKTSKWIEHVNNRNDVVHRYLFIEDIFIYNASSSSELSLKHSAKGSLKIILNTFSKLSLESNNVVMHREHYFYHYLLFYPQYRMFTEENMPSYLDGLKDLDQLNKKEKCDQIARDLVFSRYYHKTAMELGKMFIKRGKGEKCEEFIKSMKKECELYKNKGKIEKEWEKFKSC